MWYKTELSLHCRSSKAPYRSFYLAPGLTRAPAEPNPELLPSSQVNHHSYSSLCIRKKLTLLVLQPNTRVENRTEKWSRASETV